MGCPSSAVGGGVLPIMSRFFLLKGIRVSKWESGCSLTMRVFFLESPVSPVAPVMVDKPTDDASLSWDDDEVDVGMEPGIDGVGVSSAGGVRDVTSWYNGKGSRGAM